MINLDSKQFFQMAYITTDANKTAHNARKDKTVLSFNSTFQTEALQQSLTQVGILRKDSQPKRIKQYVGAHTFGIAIKMNK